MSKRLTLLAVVAMVFTGLVDVSMAANSSTRSEDLATIRTFLMNEQVAARLAEKGANIDDMMAKLDSLSDKQLDRLAQHALVQVGGDLDDAQTDDFWKTWGALALIGAASTIGLVLLYTLLFAL